MNTIKSVGVLFAALTLMCPVVDGANTRLSFDGISDGVWTISNQPTHGPVPTADIEGTVLPGIAFDDTVQGIAYYIAPASLTSMDLTGETLTFNFWIEDDSAISMPVDDDTATDLVINGTNITLDLIDETQLETLQMITIDFTDPAFVGIDLSNITSLGIRAEYWQTGNEGIESYLVAVPEPASFTLAALSLCGLTFCRRRK